MRTLPLLLEFFLIAATLTGCVAAEPQLETPDTEAARARSIGLYSARRSKRVSSGSRLTPADEERLHHAAHQGCFISNSVKTVVTVQPPLE